MLYWAKVLNPFAISRSVWLTLASLVLATGCAGGSFGDSLQKSLEADPQLQAQLPADGEAAQAEAQASSDGEPTPTPIATPGENASPQPGDGAFIGPVFPSAHSGQNPDATPGESSPSAAQGGPRLDAVPSDLKPYVQDWITLGLTSETAESPLAGLPFEPNRTLSRGAYAHWLLVANNRFYRDQPAKRIRLGTSAGTPAFQDVPLTHPHYSAIQGLAEAGIIPSALTGNATAVTFRPDDPLTREALVLWKVPLDTRAVLPPATVDAVQAAWGFQDAAEIEPLALRAVLADHQTGDFANILRAFGFTTLFQPKRAVSQAEAAAVLWRFGHQTEGISAQDVIRQTPPAAPATEGRP